jgi:excinuclease ABC subunit B
MMVLSRYLRGIDRIESERLLTLVELVISWFLVNTLIPSVLNHRVTPYNKRCRGLICFSMKFELQSEYKPAGDQPKAIKQITKNLESGLDYQTLLGVTGSGKTFTMANVIQNVQKPTLVIAHNKTLAAQLCNEFREFFPNNIVEYFVSYYDYYQPEAYMPRSDTYIEKESQINEEIDRLRHSATQALLTRRDVIIVASVSCIYSLGNPVEYKKTVLHVEKNGDIQRNDLLRRLTSMQFERTNADLTRGHFRARGDIIEIMPMNKEVVYRLVFEEEEVIDIQSLDHITRKYIDRLEDIWLFPAKHYVVSSDVKDGAVKSIRRELKKQLAKFDKEGKLLEAERLSRRTRYDLEMIKNIGYCNGIENYSSHFEGRLPGEPGFTLIDYFPDDFLTVIDESHVTVSQIGGMYNGDQARKKTLVDHGFRLPSARDNRPLQIEEFKERMNQTVFVSATPGKNEAALSNTIIEQIIRPTGLVDPVTYVRPVTEDPEKNYPGQVEDLIGEIELRVEKNERALVTTLTKKMAEDLTEFLVEKGIKVQYIHSDVETLDRITILTDLRKGVYDVVVGVNLLREGLDLPEVTLVAILDADKEGFLRSETAIVQTIGRAARNVDGIVILYADKMTGSLERSIKETDRRRKIQLAHNKKHGITPKTIIKEISDIRAMLSGREEETIKDILKLEMTAEPHELKLVIQEKTYDMKEAANKLDFETAGILRDELSLLKKELDEKEGKGKKKRKTKKKVG